MLNPDYRDMLSALFDENVDFIVVGAFALAAHGNPRATGDIDLFVRPSNGNAIRILAALRQFGAPIDQVSIEDFSREDVVFQIGLIPRRIDLLTSLEGIDSFDDAWSDRVVVDVDGFQLPVLSKKLLIKTKNAVGRPQDLADVAWLEANLS